MIDERERYERAFQQFQMTEPAWEILVDRRDRKRRNKRIAAGVVGIAVFVAAVWIVTSGLSLDRSETSVVPGGGVTGPAETGPTVTVPPSSVKPALIGTVTRSGAGCVLELEAEPIPPGASRLSLVNEMKRWVSFELLRFDPEVLTFAQLEVMVANGEYKGGTFTFAPRGVFELAQGKVGPGASGVITDNFTTGDTFAVVCLDRRSFDPGFPTRGNPENFVLVGPIVVP